MRVTLPGTKLTGLPTRERLTSLNQRSLVGHSHARNNWIEKKEERTAHESGSPVSPEDYAFWNAQAYHSNLSSGETRRESMAAPPCAGIYDRVNPDSFPFSSVV